MKSQKEIQNDPRYKALIQSIITEFLECYVTQGNEGEEFIPYVTNPWGLEIDNCLIEIEYQSENDIIHRIGNDGHDILDFLITLQISIEHSNNDDGFDFWEETFQCSIKGYKGGFVPFETKIIK